MKVLTSWELFGFGEAETETNINYGAYKQQLEHELIYSLDEECPVRCPNGWIFLVSAEVFKSLVKISDSESS